MSAGPSPLSGRIAVGLPPVEAFTLFTPRGEQDWATGWRPAFFDPVEDDTEPGTAFQTAAHGQHTIWLVLDRIPGRQIRYARVSPGDRAGTVTVTVSPDPNGAGSQVEVTYRLAALSDAGRHRLAEFAAGYAAYLRSWEQAIAALLHRRAPAPRPAGAAGHPAAPGTSGHGAPP